MSAQVNTIGNFKRVFDRMLENLFIERTEGNEEIRNRCHEWIRSVATLQPRT
jgi:hypothetical protein